MLGAIEVDYLVVGAGAAGLAFTDALVADSDATVLMVDRRHGPGGHWNDAYPFVRLHQPSAFYGVNSRHLGEDRVDESGPNAGFYERATGAEVCHYFQAVLTDHLLPTGQVELVPMSTCIEDAGRISVVSLLTGAAREVTVRRKVVDARFLESSIPATHTPTFEVDDGVQCVPVNALVHTDHAADGYVVIGAGKTAMDACTWLLDNGVESDEITWIKPRDAWALDRGAWQPREQVGRFIIGWAASVEASAAATSIPDLFARLEACGALVRVDPSVEPTMYRAAILSNHEVDQLRSVEHVVRAGHVRRLQRDRAVLDAGDDVAMHGDRLYVDCTADGLPHSVPRPIFEPTRVTIQPLRETSPTFNAALIGYLEASRDNTAEQNELAPVSAYPSAATDWIRMRRLGMIAQRAWNEAPDVNEWIERSRLNVGGGLGHHASEPGVSEAIGSYLEHTDPAIDNLATLEAQLA